MPKGLASPGHEPTFAGCMIGLMIFRGLEKSLSLIDMPRWVVSTNPKKVNTMIALLLLHDWGPCLDRATVYR